MPGILEKQAELQAQADAIVSALGLDDLLGAAGNPVRVGSSALGLMVRRDIDITVVCERLDPATRRTVAEIAGELMLDRRVGALRYRNDSGVWNAEPENYPDGLYLGLTYRTEKAEDWNFDIWFVDEPDRQPDLGHLKNLLPRLTDEVRETILVIKADLAAMTPKGGKPAPSALVYEAVLDGEVRTTAEFEEWMTRAGER
ncbi:hypothetical protein NOJ28_11680 [Neorhizobium galegae]|uniref:hypothetical protein n=1 Tax=Neorhizobium galegae TaxID=399 RepID=UPI000621BC35|nr:hypothetical protein [Neorhizobium galegae]MCQ1766196.1 hypothetical protein [Neorhizobium galegae]MCQ1845110.1 hypothetical protein [Neorhizobium galegae]CDZ40243.1 Hypothetical protein NGAL_HAMBI1146_37710 [Neorhizobium galegae bv. officinalis]